MKTLIFLFFIVSFIECAKLKFNDLCYPKEEKELKCHGNYSFVCGDFICTKSQYTCHLLSLFSGLKGEHRKNYELFMNKIKDCPELPKYKWNKNDVCLNTKNCKTHHYPNSPFHVLWIVSLKLIECKCNQKYSYVCNKDYCALDKRACDNLKKKTAGIKHCSH